MISKVIAGLYHALVYTAQKVKKGISWCLSLIYRATFIYHALLDAVTGKQPTIIVLVRLICDGSGPRFIRLCLVLLPYKIKIINRIL